MSGEELETPRTRQRHEVREKRLTYYYNQPHQRPNNHNPPVYKGSMTRQKQNNSFPKNGYSSKNRTSHSEPKYDDGSFFEYQDIRRADESHQSKDAKVQMTFLKSVTDGDKAMACKLDLVDDRSDPEDADALQLSTHRPDYSDTSRTSELLVETTRNFRDVMREREESKRRHPPTASVPVRPFSSEPQEFDHADSLRRITRSRNLHANLKAELSSSDDERSDTSEWSDHETRHDSPRRGIVDDNRLPPPYSQKQPTSNFQVALTADKIYQLAKSVSLPPSDRDSTNQSADPMSSFRDHLVNVRQFHDNVHRQIPGQHVDRLPDRNLDLDFDKPVASPHHPSDKPSSNVPESKPISMPLVDNDSGSNVDTCLSFNVVKRRLQKIGISSNVIDMAANNYDRYSIDIGQEESSEVLVKVCPDCVSLNKHNLTWCLNCGCVLMGIDAVPKTQAKEQATAEHSNRKEERSNMLDINIQDEEDEGDEVLENVEDVQPRVKIVTPQHATTPRDLTNYYRVPPASDVGLSVDTVPSCMSMSAPSENRPQLSGHLQDAVKIGLNDSLDTDINPHVNGWGSSSSGNDTDNDEDDDDNEGFIVAADVPLDIPVLDPVDIKELNRSTAAFHKHADIPLLDLPMSPSQSGRQQPHQADVNPAFPTTSQFQPSTSNSQHKLFNGNVSDKRASVNGSQHSQRNYSAEGKSGRNASSRRYRHNSTNFSNSSQHKEGGNRTPRRRNDSDRVYSHSNQHNHYNQQSRDISDRPNSGSNRYYQSSLRDFNNERPGSGSNMQGYHMTPHDSRDFTDRSAGMSGDARSKRGSRQSTERNNQRRWQTSSGQWSEQHPSVLKKKPSEFVRRTYTQPNKFNEEGNLPYFMSSKTQGESRSNLPSTQQAESSAGAEGDAALHSTPRELDAINLESQEVSQATQDVLLKFGWDTDASIWLYLPDELWLRILSLLPRSSLAAVSATCSVLHRISQDSTLWRQISLVRHHGLTNDNMAAIGRRKPTELVFHNCHGNDITLLGLKEMFMACSDSLRKLSFISCSRGAFQGDQLLLLSAVYCQNLTSVDASYAQNVRDTTVVSLAEASLGLDTVLLNGAQCITDEGIMTLVKYHKNSLTRLELYGCFNLTSASLRQISQCTKLSGISLGSITRFSGQSIVEMVSKLGSLTVLDLRGAGRLLDLPAVLQIAGHCPLMTELTLANVTSVTDAAIDSLAKGMPRLKMIDVCGCTQVGNTGMMSLARESRQLEEVDLSSTQVDAQGVLYFARSSSKKLKCLRLNFCRDINEHCLEVLVSECPDLMSLYLYGNEKVTNATVLHQINPRFSIKQDDD